MILQKSFTIFVWHNFSREHFKILLGNMGTKDDFMREQGNKGPPIRPSWLKFLRFIVIWALTFLQSFLQNIRVHGVF